MYVHLNGQQQQQQRKSQIERKSAQESERDRLLSRVFCYQNKFYSVTTTVASTKTLPVRQSGNYGSI